MDNFFLNHFFSIKCKNNINKALDSNLTILVTLTAKKFPKTKKAPKIEQPSLDKESKEEI